MFDSIAKENTKLHNCNWQKISNYHLDYQLLLILSLEKKHFFY